MLKSPLDKNRVDDLADALVNIMRYSDSTVEYPNIAEAKRDDGVVAEWFYPVLNETNDFSELTAIHMYIAQETAFEEIGELFLGVALTEMQHYSKVSDFVRKIGGKVNRRFDNSKMIVGETVQEALKAAVDSESKTISAYRKILKRLQSIQETTTVRVALQLLTKLIADETIHLMLFNEQFLNAGREVSTSST